MALTYLNAAMIEQPTELPFLSARNLIADNISAINSNTDSASIFTLSTTNIYTNNLINDTELFGNLTIYGAITALSGGIDVINTLSTTATSLNINSIGLEPALRVSQTSNISGIATFLGNNQEVVRINNIEPNIGQAAIVISKIPSNRSLSAAGLAFLEEINTDTFTVNKQINLTNLDAVSANIGLITNNRINSNTINTQSLTANSFVMSENSVSIFDDIIVNGQIFALQGIENISSFISETSTLSVVNTGPGPAFTVKQSPEIGSIASFFGDNVEVLRINNPFPTPAQPGIVVIGNVYANGGDSTIWNNTANILAGGGLSEFYIGANAITTSKIASNAVDNTKLGDSSVTETKIATNTVTESKIASNAITESKIASNAITESKIASSAIVNSKVASNAAIDGTKINPNFGSQNIVTTGNVGIGTTTPGAKLEINGSIAETKSTPAISSNTLTLDANSGTLFFVNLNADITSAITVSNIPASPRVYSFTLQFTYPDNVARTVTWPSNTKWSSNTPPRLTCLIDKTDTFVFLTHDGGLNWYGFVSAQDQ
jgi:hypothetical protein